MINTLKSIIKGIRNTFLVGAVYISTLMSAQYISSYNSFKIENYSQLERVLDREMKMLDDKFNN